MMIDAFNRWFRSDEPFSIHDAFAAGWDAAPCYFWHGFVLATINTLALVGIWSLF